MIRIFMESEEPEIKSKQADKRDRTYLIGFDVFWHEFEVCIIFYEKLLN